MSDFEASSLAAETIRSSWLYNKDLAPVSPERRTWGTYAYAALWISMSVNIPTYMLASGMIAGGMNWKQALFTVFLGNVLVLIPMLLNAHAGTRYGIPFPVFARASFGVLGANVPAVLRALGAHSAKPSSSCPSSPRRRSRRSRTGRSLPPNGHCRSIRRSPRPISDWRSRAIMPIAGKTPRSSIVARSRSIQRRPSRTCITVGT